MARRFLEGHALGLHRLIVALEIIGVQEEADAPARLVADLVAGRQPALAAADTAALAPARLR